MSAICFNYDSRNPHRDLWLYLVTFFDVEAYERGRPDDLEAQTHFGVISISAFYELQGTRPMILVQPNQGLTIHGDISIDDFTFPDDAVYLFGMDDQSLHDDDFIDMTLDAKIYIPSASHKPSDEIFTHQAGAILLHELRKRSIL